MCGLLFLQQNKPNVIDFEMFEAALQMQSWRGPDATGLQKSEDGHFYFGHNRLTILDSSEKANMPMTSSNGRYTILYNGEIYNHQALRDELDLSCTTGSDTETILEGYAKIGEEIFTKLDGMFAIVLYDKENHSWICARDPLGIKPLFYYKSQDVILIGSEPAPIANLIGANPSKDSIKEWKLIRRPMPGCSYFEHVNEVLPGTVMRSDASVSRFWAIEDVLNGEFSQDVFEEKIRESIFMHEMNDYETVSFISGGLDSAVVSAVSSVGVLYTVGLSQNNEFEGAKETANIINKAVKEVEVAPKALEDAWRKLTVLRGEPLSVPNEGLIHLACQSMGKTEKVVLTGEGADELLFGYDRIFKWASEQDEISIEEFLERYAYHDSSILTSRLRTYIEKLMSDKKPVEFIEDFFIYVHLPGLLRRMDFGSMSASKEARVPFVTKGLYGYMYRRSFECRNRDGMSKYPLKLLALKLGLEGAVNRKKIGFSATLGKGNSRFSEYDHFQNIVLTQLGWEQLA